MELEDKRVDGEADLEPFLGFTEEDEAHLYPIVDATSAMLYDIVQGLEMEFLEAVCDKFVKSAHPVVVPESLLEAPGGSRIIIEEVRIGDKVYTTGRDKRPAQEDITVIGAARGATAPAKGALAVIKMYSSPAFSIAELELLRKPLEQGKYTQFLWYDYNSYLTLTRMNVRQLQRTRNVNFTFLMRFHLEFFFLL